VTIIEFHAIASSITYNETFEKNQHQYKPGDAAIARIWVLFSLPITYFKTNYIGLLRVVCCLHGLVPLPFFFWAARLLLLVFLSLVFRKKGKVSPYSITERMVPQLIPVLSSQPAGNVSHKPGGRLPLLSARPAVTLATLNRAATSFEAW